jgi:hypothetical protein
MDGLTFRSTTDQFGFVEEVGGRLAESETCRTSDTHTPVSKHLVLAIRQLFEKNYVDVYIYNDSVAIVKRTLASMTVHWRVERLHSRKMYLIMLPLRNFSSPYQANFILFKPKL